MAERIDSLHLEGYSIIQDKETFCYGIDAVLLADFAIKNSQLNGASNGTVSVFDLGTGNGIIPVLIAAQSPLLKKDSLKITGLELQEKMADMACRSVKLNNLDPVIKICQKNIVNVPSEMEEGCADIVVSNPPYMIPSRGRQSSNIAKMTARQELFCTLNDVVKAAAHLLGKKENKPFFMIHRPERLNEIFDSLSSNGFNNITYQLVKPFSDKPATMVLIHSLRSQTELKTELKPLVIYEKPGEYTEEIKSIYKY